MQDLLAVATAARLRMGKNKKNIFKNLIDSSIWLIFR
jgi:hypothetical protein